MATSSPPELVRLLNSAPPDREAAWESFLAIHYRLLLHVTRAFAKEHDAAMDAFAWMLERLPGKLLTRDNLASMRVDNVCDCPYPAVFGGHPRGMESVVPEYLSPAARTDPFAAYRRRHR